MTSREVKIAKLSDSEKIKDILYQTAKWLNKKGSKQWSGLLKGEDVHNIEEAIKREEVFLVYINNELIGTFAMWDKQTEWDSDLWENEQSTDYYYLHRIALTTASHGKHFGKALLKSAKEVTYRRKKKELRLDCIANNAYLNNFYKNNEFKLYNCIREYDNGEGLQDYNLYFWKVSKNY